MGEKGSRVSLIGGGRIGRFIIKRLLKAYPNIEILASTRTQKSSSSLRERFPSVSVTTNNKEALSFSDMVFLCIRPDNLGEFLEQISGFSIGNKTIISLLVIFEPHELGGLLGTRKVCVFHPTTYLHYSEEDFLKSFLIFSDNFTKQEKEVLNNFLSKAFGYIEEEDNLISLKEKIFLYGNFPAYLVEFIDRLILELCKRLNISEEQAKRLIVDVLKLTEEQRQAVKSEVATPGGITQRGLITIDRTLEELMYSLEGNTFLKIDKARETYGKL